MKKLNLSELKNPPKEVQEKFTKRLFSIILTVPETAKTLQSAFVVGIFRGISIILKEISKDVGDNMLLSMLASKGGIGELFPGTTTLLAWMMPYFGEFGLSTEDLLYSLIDKRVFLKQCNEAAGEDPELQEIAKTMAALVELTDSEMDEFVKGSSQNTGSFVEEF